MPPPPGDLVGRYQITGTMDTDSCGPGFGANRSVRFDAELRRDDDTAFWIFGDLDPTTGTLDDNGAFLFQRQGGWTLVDAKPEIGYAGCRVGQLETIQGAVLRSALADDADAGAEDAGEGDASDDEIDIEIAQPALTGRNTIDIVPLTGDDCSPALSTQGGPFLALPCRVAYQLTGTLSDED